MGRKDAALKWQPVGSGTPGAASGQGPSAKAAKKQGGGVPARKPAVAGRPAVAKAAGAAAASGPMAGSFIPPGCDASCGEYVDDDEGGTVARCYEESLARGFWCPPRLKGRNESLIEAVNDWHYAMLNDTQRNQFYWDSMANVVQGKRVIDIGAGSALLSLMASKQGASKVLAIEASRDMVDLAKLNVERNGEKGKITIIHNLSSMVSLAEEEKADAIVSETLGALMLGEGMLDYMADARRRLARPGAIMIPAGGAQYAVLIYSSSLAMVSNVNSQCCQGFDLSAIGSLQDTGNLFFTKQWGFRLNSMTDLKEMSERVKILEVEFGHTERSHIPATKTFRLQALHDGIVHAVVASWDVWATGRAHRITTHPEDTKNEPWGFARDMQWGQGLQLVEDFDAAGRSERNAAPAPFEVKAGEPLLLTVRFSVPCRQTFQFTLRRENQQKA